MDKRSSFYSSMILSMGNTVHNYKLWELEAEEEEGCSNKNTNSRADMWSYSITELHKLWGIRTLH